MRGAVLAGGAASRYGGIPKGLLEVGGERILDRVVRVVQAVTETPPLLIANDPDAASWRPDLKAIPDVRPGFGALSGLYTAVTAGGGGAVLCVAWDMPFVPEALLRALIAGATAGRYDAFLPESRGPRGLEPLCAAYGPACGPAIAERLDQRVGGADLAAISFHAAVRVGILSLAQVKAFGDPDELFLNVNAPEDLERAEALWQRRG